MQRHFLKKRKKKKTLIKKVYKQMTFSIITTSTNNCSNLSLFRYYNKRTLPPISHLLTASRFDIFFFCKFKIKCYTGSSYGLLFVQYDSFNCLAITQFHL